MYRIFHSCLSIIISAALRFCRRIIGLKEESYNQYVVKNNLLAPVVKAFLANGRKYNLLNSAIIEMFEFIKSVRDSVVKVSCQIYVMLVSGKFVNVWLDAGVVLYENSVFVS